MANFKTALAVLFVFLGLPLIWVSITFIGNTIINWLHNAGLDWLFGSLLIATIVWFYIKVVAALWK